MVKGNGDWVTPEHSTDGFWVKNSPAGEFSGPIQVKMTSANGYELQDVISGGIGMYYIYFILAESCDSIS